MIDNIELEMMPGDKQLYKSTCCVCDVYVYFK
jgi:hypothetical protein